MLMQPTLEKLHALKLTGMAAAYQKQLEEPETGGSATDGSGHGTRPDQFAMGRATSQRSVHRSHRDREDVAGSSPGAEGLPRRIQSCTGQRPSSSAIWLRHRPTAVWASCWSPSRVPMCCW